MKYIKDKVDRKMMVKKLIELGANPLQKNYKDLYAHQAYAEDYGLDEAAIYLEKATYFTEKKQKGNQVGSVYDLEKDITLDNEEELKQKILDKLSSSQTSGAGDSTTGSSPERTTNPDIEAAMEKKDKILDTLSDVQHTQPLDPQKEYNDQDELKTQLKKKRMEVVGKDIINSFQKYH